MTFINVASSIIYTKDAPLREKIQTYGLALVFLVLLYNSPSGLVFYWVFNQIFSLCKNIVLKMKHPGRIVHAFLSAIFVLASVYFLFFRPLTSPKKKIIVYAFTLIFVFAPMVWKILKSKGFLEKIKFSEFEISEKQNLALFILSCISLVVFIGIYIPGSVIASSPAEFSFLKGDSSPFILLWDSFVKAFGLFLFWPFVIYKMFGTRVRKILPFVFLCFITVATLNFFVFPSDYGLISQLLTIYDVSKLKADFFKSLLNLVLIFFLFLICVFLFFKQQKFMTVYLIFSIIFSLSIDAISFLQFMKIKSGYKNALYIKNGDTAVSKKQSTAIKPIIKFSQTGNNVFIIMLDRGTGAFLQECFKEDEHLYEQYDGFTFYPNTVSFSYGTLAGSPPLYGGYEYTPAIINLRDKDTIVQKQQEAISMLPRLFAKNGYSALMADMPWVGNYSKLSDYYFMNKYEENIETVSIGSRYADIWKLEHFENSNNYQLESNQKLFPLYSLMMISPLCMRKMLYNGGKYFTVPIRFGAGESYDTTIACYSGLDYLPKLTEIIESGNNFAFIENDLIHAPNVLQVPEYKPVETITKESDSKYASEIHYYVNMAALKLLGKWFDYLKENNVYDNSRIIISADHGGFYNKDIVEEYAVVPRSELPCLLLVKDFNSRGMLNIDNSFMTNADVPSIAVKDLIENPINLATGRDFTKFVMKNPVYGEYTGWRDTENHEGNVLTVHEGDWYSIRDSIFEAINWNNPSSEEVYNMTRNYVQNFDTEAAK